MREMYLIDIYTDVKKCVYKGETYSVRNNGAVMRHSKPNAKVRRYDNIWTFGTTSRDCYKVICAESVHRIVAYAYLGEPPSPDYVVDHIDTNRQNNRPENLRWLTRLENAILNPITRKRIERLCGSIEAFLKDPSMIRKLADYHPCYSWMRTVSKEEAEACRKRMMALSQKETRKNEGHASFGEWVFATKSSITSYPRLIPSLSPNALQKDWKTPTEFLLCPKEIGDKPLVDYYNNLKPNEIFSKSQYSSYSIDDFALYKDYLLICVHNIEQNVVNDYSLVIVVFEGNAFVHSYIGFMEERGAKKALTILQGLEWTGEAGIDDETKDYNYFKILLK